MEIEHFNFLTFDEVESTNDLAFSLIKEGCAGNNFIIIANTQSKGRGRRDRSWTSPAGNIYLSLILQFTKIDNITDYSFLTACAIGDALRSYDINSKYKWPNDIILDNKKLAGILLQLEKINNVYNLVIGVGLNLVSSPSYAVSLADCKISKEDFIKQFCAAFLNCQNQYKQFGFSVIKAMWKKYAYKMKEHIKLSNNMEGIFLDIDEVGNLILLDEKDKIHKILAEEIL
jgi:BirA family biotin operon repressor/biotin-[acetyl-CoA-carboxylase] ligase